MDPDVGAVMGHEDRQIAHDDNPSRAAGVAHALPLLEEEELRQLVHPHVPGQSRRPPRDGRRITRGDGRLPIRPGRLIVSGLDGHEEREIVQPTRVPAAEPIEAIAQGGGSRRLEAIEHARPERLAVCDDGGEIDVSVGKRRLAARLGGREPSLFDQRIEADEQRIARECGETLVRGIAVAGGTERQHLPEALAGRGEQIDELEGARAQIPDAEASGQGGRMQEHAARTGRRHVAITDEAWRPAPAFRVP